MLEGLSAIDWGKLHHAYGTAEDVPQQLRDLISTEPKRRDEALHELYGNIWHQSTIYEATSHAVPFLWEILTGPERCDRSGVASLIGAIANGGSLNRSRPTPQEKTHIAACRAAVRKGLGIAESNLASDDVTLRMLCAHVIASFPEDAERFRPALRNALLREKDVGRRAGLGMALMIMGEPAPDAFVPGTPTPLPLSQLLKFAQRAADNLTDRENVLDFIFELSLENVDVEQVIHMLEDRERWGGEDEL